jgi:uncharacterized RDD family membrane protein YckC
MAALFDHSKADTSLGALTPEGIEFVLFPAGLPVRSIAYGIDKIIQWLIIIVIWLSFISLQVLGAWFFLIFNFCIDWFYHIFCELVFHGQTPGKKIMKIRVVKSRGSPVDPASSFLRNLLRFADTFCFLCPIALLSMSISPGFRRLGDWAGDTLVVYTARQTKIPAGNSISWLSVLAPVVPARPLSLEEKQAVLTFARRYPLLGEARANEIARSLAPLLCANGVSEAGGKCLSGAASLLGIARYLSVGSA